MAWEIIPQVCHLSPDSGSSWNYLQLPIPSAHSFYPYFWGLGVGGSLTLSPPHLYLGPVRERRPDTTVGGIRRGGEVP